MTMTTISTPMDMSALAQRLTSNTWTLAAIAALFESGLAEQLREPQTVDDLAAKSSLPSGRIERCLAVCVSVGVVIADGPAYRLAEGTLACLCGPMRAGFQADLRSQLMQSLTFLDAMATRDPSTGWRHTDPTILQAQGDASAGFPPMLKARFVATLGDLAARLERPGARFLDVGVGVGALTISMCRLWPEVHAVGLDIYDAPLALARDNIAAANLGSRVELRQLAVEALRDESAFDLAWVPSFFIPPDVLASAVARVAASLRPGGWILLSGMGLGDEANRATTALLNELWGGGPVRGAAGLEAVLNDAGLSAVRILPSPPSLALVAGQRA